MIAEFERGLISMRTKEGIAVARAKAHLKGKQRGPSSCSTFRTGVSRPPTPRLLAGSISIDRRLTALAYVATVLDEETSHQGTQWSSRVFAAGCSISASCVPSRSMR